MSINSVHLKGCSRALCKCTAPTRLVKLKNDTNILQYPVFEQRIEQAVI